MAFKSLGNRSPQEIAADELNNNWAASRRALRPQAAPSIAGSSRLSDVHVPDPVLERAREKAAREVANKEHKKLTAKAERAHRHKLLTEVYTGSPQLMDLLNTCNRMTPSRVLSSQDYKCQCTMGLERANEFLDPPLTDAEAVTVMQFFHAQLPNLYPDSTSWIVACDILTAENVIRQTVFFQPVTEPEPVAAGNPHPYSDYSGSDFAKWERAQLVRDFDQEHLKVFRTGLAAASAELGGLEISEADVKFIREKCSSLPFHEWTSERIKNVAVATLAGPIAVQRDPEDSLSSLEYLRAHKLGTSYQRQQ